MPDKQQLLATLHAEYERWQDLLTGLDETQLTSRTLPADLSIKDVLGHLHAWQQISVARLQAVLEDREPVYPAWLGGLEPDVEENLEWINATIHAMYSEEPWPVVHEMWMMGFLHLLDLAAAIPERDLFDSERYAWLGYAPADVLQGTYEHHHDEHYTPLLTSL
mgnify:FL=1